MTSDIGAWRSPRGRQDEASRIYDAATLADAVRLAEDWERSVAHLREAVVSPVHTDVLDRWKREFRAEQRAQYEITHPRRAEIMRGLNA